MKKLLSLVLTLTLAFSLAACTNSGTTENSDSVSSPASEGIAPAENESSAEEASQPETEAGSAGHCPGGTGERRPSPPLLPLAAAVFPVRSERLNVWNRRLL